MWGLRASDIANLTRAVSDVLECKLAFSKSKIRVGMWGGGFPKNCRQLVAFLPAVLLYPGVPARCEKLINEEKIISLPERYSPYMSALDASDLSHAPKDFILVRATKTSCGSYPHREVVIVLLRVVEITVAIILDRFLRVHLWRIGQA